MFFVAHFHLSFLARLLFLVFGLCLELEHLLVEVHGQKGRLSFIFLAYFYFFFCSSCLALDARWFLTGSTCWRVTNSNLGTTSLHLGGGTTALGLLLKMHVGVAVTPIPVPFVDFDTRQPESFR